MTSLSHLEFDFIWEHLGLGEAPYPIDVASFGKTMDERAMLREQVRESLRAKGLHDGATLSPRLEEMLTLLVRGALTVDGQLSVGEYVRVLAASRGVEGVLAAQTDEEIRVVPVREGKVVSAVIALLPDEKPGPGGAARLPRRLFDDAIDEYQQSGYLGLERTLTAGGVTGRDLRTVITLVESARHGGGQLAANRVDPVGRRSRTPVVNWFDTAAGRYLAHVEVTPDRVEWLTIAPADTARIERRLSDLIVLR
ncbi:ESX secretion-associated protein EspG [Actinophytocola sp.]|uniref:ESX secretion-associated protein EspG n=1 Tax=Actinophytocola sp. TaxID=1872138 RepID=UPI003D6B1E0A